MFKAKLTEVAVDAFADYMQERFDKLKQFDLDADGVKDVEQVKALLRRCADKAKAALNTTDFSNMAAGLEQITTGAALIGNSFDKEKMRELGQELHSAGKELTKLSQLTVQYVKEHGKDRT
jgi:hypothetical protein